MRVLHVLHTSLPHVCGYSLRSNQIVQLQRAFGLDVAVVTSGQQPPGDNTPGTVDGVNYFRVPNRKLYPPPFRELQLMAGLRRALGEACATFRPDIVHAHSPVLVGMPSLAVSKRRNLPFVYEVRDLWENASVDRGKFVYDSWPYRIARALETRVLRRADAVFTIGENLRRELEPRTRTPILLAPNGVDTETFVPEPAREDWIQRWNPGRGPLLAYVGSFQPYEGLDILLKALPLVRVSRPEAKLLIAGDGPERSNLEALAKSLNLGQAVTFAGRVPHAQVREIYAVATVLVYPRIETLTTRLTTPLKPLEAMSAGKAVAASDLPAIRELVSDGVTGLLFEAGSVDDLARQTLSLLQSPELRSRLGAAARAALTSRTWRSSVLGYPPVYEQLLTRRRQ